MARSSRWWPPSPWRSAISPPSIRRPRRAASPPWTGCGRNELAPLVEARGVHKSYWLGEKEIHVLRGATFSLEAGEMASLVGPSGVGKSTFLHVIGTLDPPTEGQVLFEGRD